MLPFTQQDLLASARIITLGDIYTSFAGSAETPLRIAPLNARINFTSFSPVPTREQTARFMAAGEEALPDTWSWRADQIDSSWDQGERLSRKKLITPILNQGVCGSCWAVSTAAAISDVFTVDGFIQNEVSQLTGQPEAIISPTSLLACYRNDYAEGCEGGLPMAVLGGDGGRVQGINTAGVYSSNCNSYEWCYDNQYCSGQETFSGDENSLMSELNSMIPKCGCINPDKKLKFTVKNVISIPGNTTDQSGNAVPVRGDTPDQLENTWNIVRSHIWNYGPAVGGYIVLANFMGGDFSETDGVYFEDGNYNGKGKQQIGAHAVRIVGWGIQKNCRTPSGDKKDVPYWMVANSWGPQWGDKGYFKIARYPFNKISQFDAAIPDANSTFLGGFVLFEAGDVTPGNWEKSSVGFKVANPDFYNSEVAISNKGSISGGGPGPSPSDNVPFYQQPYFIIILLLVFVGLIIASIVYFSKKRTVSSTGEYTGYASLDVISSASVPRPVSPFTPQTAPQQFPVAPLAMRKWKMQSYGGLKI